MDNQGFAFEQRSQENKLNDMEYNKGGGGGGPRGFFSVKTNVYSKECYSDPNNPGKMICKETNNMSGYDPFNREMNYNKSKENIYTKNYSNMGAQYPEINKEESIFDKISGKFKKFFSSHYDEFGNKQPIENNQTNFNQNSQYHINYSHTPEDRFNTSNTHNTYSDPNDFNGFNWSNRQDNQYNYARDPMFDEFERMINHIQSSFFRGSFFDHEMDKEFPQEGIFFGGIPFIRDRDEDFNNFDNFSKNINFRFTPNENNLNNINPGLGSSDFQRSFENRNQFTNQSTQEEQIKEIKYRDSKIYDV